MKRRSGREPSDRRTPSGDAKTVPPTSARRRRLRRRGSASSDAPEAGSGPRQGSDGVIRIVDEGLDDSGPLDAGLGTRVVIGGFDDTDAGRAAEHPAPTVDPRLRARRRDVRRSQGRRRRRVLGAIAVVVVLAGIALALVATPLVAVRQVDVDGAAYTWYFDGERLQGVVDDLDGAAILTVDLAGIRDRVEASPWVRRARVQRHFPDRVTIEIEERVPLAWYRGPDLRHRVLDAEGVVIAVLEGEPLDYVRIDGPLWLLEPGDTAPGVLAATAQLVRSLPDEVAGVLDHVVVDEAQEIVLMLESGTEVRLGAPDDLQAKLVALVVVLRRQDAAELTQIDISTGQPTIR